MAKTECGIHIQWNIIQLYKENSDNIDEPGGCKCNKLVTKGHLYKILRVVKFTEKILKRKG